MPDVWVVTLLVLDLIYLKKGFEGLQANPPNPSAGFFRTFCSQIPHPDLQVEDEEGGGVEGGGGVPGHEGEPSLPHP